MEGQISHLGRGLLEGHMDMPRGFRLGGRDQELGRMTLKERVIELEGTEWRREGRRLFVRRHLRCRSRLANFEDVEDC